MSALIAALCIGFPAMADPALGRDVLARELILRDGHAGSQFFFRWVAPAEVGLHPKLARSMRADAERQRAVDDKCAAALAKIGGATARMSRDLRWQAAADIPALLALWSTDWSYSGGAHGNTDYAALLWDKSAGRSIALNALLADPKAGYAALTPAFCGAIGAERAKRRNGEKLEGKEYNTCPDLTRQVIVPVVVGDGATIRRLDIKIPPYEAGPYSEGSYELTIPVPLGFVGALKHGWRDSFEVSE